MHRHAFAGEPGAVVQALAKVPGCSNRRGRARTWALNGEVSSTALTVAPALAYW